MRKQKKDKNVDSTLTTTNTTLAGKSVDYKPLSQRIDLYDQSDSPLKQKLQVLYDNQSANGGDPARSARSSRRSAKKSEIDLKLQAMQGLRSSFQVDEYDGASSCLEEHTLTICKSHEQRTFADAETLEKHLVKKLKKLQTFSSLESRDSVLQYGACEYLARLIRERGTSPL